MSKSSKGLNCYSSGEHVSIIDREAWESSVLLDAVVAPVVIPSLPSQKTWSHLSHSEPAMLSYTFVTSGCEYYCLYLRMKPKEK